MRKWIFIILVLVVTMGTASIGSAGDRAAGGLLLGAGSGALIGQAIGRSTEATLVGTAVGGVLGYIIGNEAERAYAREPVYTSYGYDEPVYYGGEGYYRESQPCREAEILGTVNGEPRKMRTTVCRDAYGRWVVNPDQQLVVVERPTVIYRKAPTVVYREPVPVFNSSLGWVFNSGHDHGWRGGNYWRGGHGWRGGSHWRGGRHR
jgi:hypothetical protein